MIRLRWFGVVLFFGLLFYGPPAHACRYNVREVGFIDVGVESYWLFGYMPETVSAEQVADLQAGLDTGLAESNIQYEVIAADGDANHPAMQYVRSHGITDRPAAVFVSPDGQSRRLPLPAGAALTPEVAATALDSVLHSPVRQRILENAVENYAVVLLIEGPDADQNAAAREVVETTIGHISEQLEFLPKPIAHPPVLVVLDRESFAQEDILLWTLGLSPEDISEPHVAVFYGRGRWIGPIFKGDALAVPALAELLFIIGADCECGLDHRWLQGTMLPLQWDEGLRQKVAQNLGFDPESPMIKMEMVSIVRRGMGGYAYPSTPPFGYQEMQVGGSAPDSESEPNDATPESAEVPSADVSLPAAVQAEVASGGGGMDIRILVATLGGMIVLVALGSIVVVLRARKA